MLNIPEAVKALFLQENVRKNLRISSPSGAFPDICNDRIVKESLKLRESVSSADSLAFGTAEGATLQFEAVGIPNILGQDIVAVLEVDASTLPPELQTVKPDIPYPVFAVPMGTYRVTACPRDKNAVPHRKVTAQQRGNDAADFLSGFNKHLVSAGVYSVSKGKVKYRVDPFDLLLANGFLPAEDYVDTITPGRLYGTIYDDTYSDTIGGTFENSRGGGHMFKLGTFRHLIQKTEVPLGTGIFSVSSDAAPLPEPQMEEAAQTIAASLYESGYYFFQTTDGDRIPLSQQQIAEKVLQLILTRWTFLLRTEFLQAGVVRTAVDYYGLKEGEVVAVNIYPDSAVTSPNNSGVEIEFHAPRLVDDVAIRDPTVINWAFDVISYSTESMGYRPTFTFSAELIEPDEYGGFRHYWSAELLSSMLLSALELAGGFGQIGRDGRKYIKYLEPSNPYTIGKEISESCWWDEFDLEPIGSIAYTHKGKDLLYSFGPGRSVYTITNTAILDRLRKYTQKQVEQFLNAQLVPHLTSIRFTPMELVCRGLPFLEAGDCIAIEADDGTMVPTYVLERNFSGIQHLTDRITADGITIVEVTE